jgi:hypothetical protein
MNGKTIIAILPYKIKADIERELYQQYTARCLRIITENTAMLSQGHYVAVELDEILNPKPEIKHIEGETSAKIKAKLRG